MPNVLRNALLIVAITSGVAPAIKSPPLHPKWLYMPGGFKNTIELQLDNRSRKAWCIPDVDTKEQIVFRQNGKTVFPNGELNRGSMFWHGADLMSGMVVVPPGKRVQLFYDLNKWDLHPGVTAVEVEFPTYACGDFFANSRPASTKLVSRTQFTR